MPPHPDPTRRRPSEGASWPARLQLDVSAPTAGFASRTHAHPPGSAPNSPCVPCPLSEDADGTRCALPCACAGPLCGPVKLSAKGPDVDVAPPLFFLLDLNIDGMLRSRCAAMIDVCPEYATSETGRQVEGRGKARRARAGAQSRGGGVVKGMMDPSAPLWYRCCSGCGLGLCKCSKSRLEMSSSHSFTGTRPSSVSDKIRRERKMRCDAEMHRVRLCTPCIL